MNQFNLNTVIVKSYQVLPCDDIISRGKIYQCSVIGKYIGGKRWKRGTVYLTQSELREIKLRELIQDTL